MEAAKGCIEALKRSLAGKMSGMRCVVDATLMLVSDIVYLVHVLPIETFFVELQGGGTHRYLGGA